MPEIKVTIRDKIAMADGTVYVCGNSDYTMAFDFDDEWSAYEAKTARFVYGGNYTDVVFTGNTCQVPVLSNVYGFTVGVFAGDLHTTTPAKVHAKKSILCSDGAPADPPEDVYHQIMTALNQLGLSGLSGDQINALDGMFKIAAYTEDATTAYAAFRAAFGLDGSGEDEGGGSEDSGETEKTLTGISAVYSGGDVTAGTAVTALTGIVVTATYSDGTSEAVTGYTLSGTIAEGSNTITVSYGGKTTTFTVTGVAEETGLEQYEYELTNTGKLGDAYGKVTNHGSYNTTDFIEVDTNTTTLTVAYNEGINQIVYVQFFNGDTFINRTQTGYSEQIHTLDIPSDATKFRVSVVAGYDFAIYKGTVTADDI